jgi:hypothetical protein
MDGYSMAVIKSRLWMLLDSAKLSTMHIVHAGLYITLLQPLPLFLCFTLHHANPQSQKTIYTPHDTVFDHHDLNTLPNIRIQHLKIYSTLMFLKTSQISFCRQQIKRYTSFNFTSFPPVKKYLLVPFSNAVHIAQSGVWV